jgi:uncharacterized repeat protein (TIGR01451 family)
MQIQQHRLLTIFINILTVCISGLIVMNLGVQPAEAQVTTLFEEDFRSTQVTDLSVWNYGVTDRPRLPDLPIYAEQPCLTAQTPQTAPLPLAPAPPPNRAGQGVGLPACPSDTKNLAGAPDADGSGVLRLTTASTPPGNTIDKRRQASFVLFNNSIPSNQGLSAEFDFFSYDGTGSGTGGNTGADGIAFFILDASQTAPITAGAVGGSLGYAQQLSGNLPGIAGGYLGIGFDEFGQFANPSNVPGTQAERNGGPGPRAQSITIRGATTPNINTSNPFLATQPSGAIPIALRDVTVRDSARRRARVNLTPAGILTVQLSTDGVNFNTVINNFDVIAAGQAAPPAQIRFGFAAATGGATNIHEIRDLVITTLPPDLSIQKTPSTANAVAGTPYTYTLSVSNSTSAGATTGAIEVVDSLPTGLNIVSATGTNWSCTVFGQTIACTYTGGSLASGAVAPDITVSVIPTAGIQASPIVNTASVTTPGDSNTADNSATATVLLTSPQLSAQKDVADLGTPPGSVNNVAEAGEDVEFTITISNTGNADSTGTELTDPIPANTQYIAGSTTLNGNPVPDTAGPTMPFTTGRLVDDGVAPTTDGLIRPGEQAVVVYQVRVDDQLPTGVTRIENQAQVNSNELPPLPPLETNLAVLPTQDRPNISLIKRIIRLVRSGVVIDFSSAEDSPPDPTFVGTVNSSLTLASGDEVTYRVYALSDGSITANNVQICDQVPTGTTYVAGSIQVSDPFTAVGTALSAGAVRTDANDGDGALFTATPAVVAVPPCLDVTNPNGSVQVEPFNLDRNDRTFLEFNTRVP